MHTPSLTACHRYLELHQCYLVPALTEVKFKEYKRLNLQFALLNWSVGSVKAYVRKEQQKCAK